MSSHFLEIFFISFAWSFWPTLFLLVTIYVTRKFIIGINDAVKDRNVEGKIKKKERIIKSQNSESRNSVFCSIVSSPPMSIIYKRVLR